MTDSELSILTLELLIIFLIIAVTIIILIVMTKFFNEISERLETLDDDFINIQSDDSDAIDDSNAIDDSDSKSKDIPTYRHSRHSVFKQNH